MRYTAVGGGHGTAVTLRALRLLGGDVAAVVSVADDGGSTGVLRDALGIAGVGDIRKCLVALANEHQPWEEFFEYRFPDDSLGRHALGNLFLAAALGNIPSLEGAIATVGQLIGSTGLVLPASRVGVDLEAETSSGTVHGQVAIGDSTGISVIRTTPQEVRAPDAVVEVIENSDLVVIGPGSLYTSVLAACVVPGITDALSRSSAKRVWVANLQEEIPETSGLGISGQLQALRNHGVPVDYVVVNESCAETDFPDVGLIRADVAGANGKVHDPEKLARVFSEVMAN